jgi:hypothetical protein
LPATSVTIALPAAPVVIAKVASVEPAGITTGPAIDATLGSLLVITSSVSAAAGAARMRSVTVRVLDAGTITSPADENGKITAPTGGANTGGVLAALGVPMTTRSSRPVPPPTSWSTASPLGPAAIARLTVVEPAGTTTGPATLATPASLLETRIGTFCTAGSPRSRIETVLVVLGATATSPAEENGCTATPKGAATASSVEPAASAETDAKITT